MLDSPSPSHLSNISDTLAIYDTLNFTPYAKTLADFLANLAIKTPQAMGVFGAWATENRR